MRISGVNRSSTVAWGASSEHSSLLAAGTVAGAISDNFDSSACLEVFKLDTSSPSGELSLLGSVQTSERFHRLAWGTQGMANGSMPYGMLAGGMVDGTIKIFSPATMIACAPRLAPDTPALCSAARQLSRLARRLTPHTCTQSQTSLLLRAAEPSS